MWTWLEKTIDVVGDVVEEWNAAGDVVDSLTSLPPTYEQGETGNYPQIVPDQVSSDVLEYRLKQVDEANERLEKAKENRKNKK